MGNSDNKESCNPQSREIKITVLTCEHGIKGLALDGDEFNQFELLGVLQTVVDTVKSQLKTKPKKLKARRSDIAEKLRDTLGLPDGVQIKVGSIDDLPTEVFNALSETIDRKRSEGNHNKN